MLTEELLIESLFVNCFSDVSRINKRLGIDVNDDLSRRIIGLLLYLAEHDFYSFLHTAKLIGRAETLDIKASREFFLENISVILDCLGDRFTVSKKTVVLSNFFYVFGVERLNEAVIRNVESCLISDLSELRDAYSSMRLIVERPQFLIVREGRSVDRELLEFLAGKLEGLLSEKVKKRSFRSRSNILFIFGHAQPLSHIGSHWRQVITYVTGFCEAFPDRKIKLIVTNESVTKDFAKNLHALPRSWERMLIGQAEIVYGKTLPRNLSISLYNPANDKNALTKIRDEIIRFNPSVAFSWLGFFSADLYFKAISRLCTIYSIQFQAGNKPNQYSKVIFSQGDFRNQDKSKIFPGYSYINNPIPLVPEPNRGIWTKVKASSDCLNIVTTLGNGRIERVFDNYSDNFVSAFSQFLENYPNVTWSFVGVTQKEIVLQNEFMKELFQSGKIHFYERVEDLRSFYQHHSVYVHMPRMHGGGWGIGLAVFEGLPVLCQSGGDADNFLPQESLFSEESEFFNKLGVLASDDKVRLDLVQLQFKKLQEHSPLNVAKSILKTVHKFENE